MSHKHPEQFPSSRRIRTSREYTMVKTGGTALRGRYCLLLVLAHPSEPTRIGFIASYRGVGGSVQRNRARRRLREIIRRRWPRIPHTGYWLVFVAARGTLGATHQELATEVERLLAAAGALEPIQEELGAEPCAPSPSS